MSVSYNNAKSQGFSAPTPRELAIAATARSISPATLERRAGERRVDVSAHRAVLRGVGDGYAYDGFLYMSGRDRLLPRWSW